MIRDWKSRYLLDTPVRPLSEIIGEEDELRVYAVNGDALPFDGWVALTVNLMGNEDPNLSITEPFLVSSCYVPGRKVIICIYFYIHMCVMDQCCIACYTVCSSFLSLSPSLFLAVLDWDQLQEITS